MADGTSDFTRSMSIATSGLRDSTAQTAGGDP